MDLSSDPVVCWLRPSARWLAMACSCSFVSLSAVPVACAIPLPVSSLAPLACCLDARTEPCHHLSYIGLILLRNAIYHKVICLHCSAVACLADFAAIHHALAPSKARFNLGPNTPSIRGHRIMDCLVAPLAASARHSPFCCTRRGFQLILILEHATLCKCPSARLAFISPPNY